MADRSILLFGGGRMGLAMLRGWIDAGFQAAINIIEPTPGNELIRLVQVNGCSLNGPAVPRTGQAIILAVKPQIVMELREVASAAVSSDTLVISIMAGKTLADLGGLFPNASAFIRAAPNLPAAVGRGVTVAKAGEGCSPAQRAFAGHLLSGTGFLEWFEDEALMDIATALSGSGPGYLFYIADCLTQAGIAAGLDPGISEKLARATFAGVGEMLRLSEKSAAELRRDVTSPAGTTEAGLRVLMANDRMATLFTDTVAAAVARSRELAG